jgi:hypothetical protein
VEAIESLIASFQQYLNKFSLGLVVRKGMMSNQISLQLRCQDNKVTCEFRLLAALLAVARDGDINLVRRCAVCGRWMHAHQPDQTYHQKKCRQIAWQSKPEVREKRREDRKRRYWEEKEKDRRALKRARQPGETRGSQRSYGRESI